MLTKQFFGTTPEGHEVCSYSITNSNGMEIEILNYGGIIKSLKVPDKNEKLENVVLGFDSFEEYLNNDPYFGAIIGRFANRIANGKFKLDGQEYTLALNNGPNSLHGGIKGFDKVVWEIEELETKEGDGIQLSYLSPNGEEGFPGNLKCKVRYILKHNNSLEVIYEAETDQKTIINFTQHSYFNLSADFSKDILDHQVSVLADHFLPVNEDIIPTGEYRPVKSSPFDFTDPKPLGKDIHLQNDQMALGHGYDHCWVLNNPGADNLAATAYHPGSGRYLEVFTDEPGIQLYTGNFLSHTSVMPGIPKFVDRGGFCLETQHFPDSPNQPNFPSVVLIPGEKFKSKTIFKFSIQ